MKPTIVTYYRLPQSLSLTFFGYGFFYGFIAGVLFCFFAGFDVPNMCGAWL